MAKCRTAPGGSIPATCRSSIVPSAARGRTPILIMHGANYFNSYDWIGVAERARG